MSLNITGWNQLIPGETYTLTAEFGTSLTDFGPAATTMVTMPSFQAPTNLQTTTVEFDEVRLAWTKPPNSDDTHTRIIRKTKTTGLEPDATTDSASLIEAYTDTTVTEGVTYIYEVLQRTQDQNGNFHEGPAATIEVDVPRQIGTPQNYTGTPVSVNRIELSYDAPTDASVTHIRQTRSGGGLLLNPTSTSTLASAIDSWVSLIPGQTYTLTAAFGTSATVFGPVATTMVTTPAFQTPTNLQTTTVEFDQVFLTWTKPPNSDFTTTTIIRKTKTTGLEPDLRVNGTDIFESYDDTTVTESVTYIYEVFQRTQDEDGTFHEGPRASIEVEVPEEDEEQADTGSVTITYHGNAAKRASNLTVVRRDHKDVHFTWEKPTNTDATKYFLYRQWKGANADGILCLHGGMSTKYRTSYTDTSVASYHPGGNEAKYEYRLYSRAATTSVACDRNSWFGGDYVKIVVQVNHHEDVYAAMDTSAVRHNDPQVPTFTSVTAEGASAGVIGGSYIVARWNSIHYAPGYRVQYKKTSEADTEWKSTYQFRIFEPQQEASPQWDNCTGSPTFSPDESGDRAEERGVGTRTPSTSSTTCRRNNYPTDQVGHHWPPYWGADGYDTRHAPTRVILQRLDGSTQYDIRIAMCTELEDSSTRGLPVCADVGDYSTKRTITTKP